MALKRATFSLRRRRSLGFSKWRWARTSLSVPSRSIFFFNRRRARSTDSPFFSLISVNSNSLPLWDVQWSGTIPTRDGLPLRQGVKTRECQTRVSTGKNGRNGPEFRADIHSGGRALRPSDPDLPGRRRGSLEEGRGAPRGGCPRRKDLGSRGLSPSRTQKPGVQSGGG